jgi:eukaryotic-like serine/threonine-protein kinase
MGTGLPDRYRLIRRIAAGGMATVYGAEDAVLGRRVAIKLLADHFADDFLAVRRFKREARTAARVSAHPNIVTIFDVGETVPAERREPARPFIVMEHLPCGTAGDAIGVGEFSRDDALRWIREASAALDYAHEHGVIHRDIKPANMLLDRSRSLHVGDFGIARIAHEDTITKGGQMFGTAAYLSPEQARGEPGTEASDRYALAVVAYELLTGERLFKGQHFAAQARAHIEDTPPRASEVSDSLPPAIDDVLTRGLAKAPEDRWPSAGAFADALATAMRPPRRPSAPPETVVFTRHPTNARPRAIAIAALVAAVAVIGAAVVIAAAGSGSPKPSHTTAAHTTAHRIAPVHHRKVHARAPTHTTSTTSSTAASTTTTTPTPAPTPPPTSAAALEARGHSLLSAGNPGAAIPVLRRAVATASQSSLTYAYALFDLGHALRLAGDLAAAVPILKQRLRIPNQTGVRAELNAALAAGHPSTGAAPVKPGDHHGHRPSGGEAPGRAKKP